MILTQATQLAHSCYTRRRVVVALTSLTRTAHSRPSQRHIPSQAIHTRRRRIRVAIHRVRTTLTAYRRPRHRIIADPARLAARARIIIERQLADPPEPLASPFPDGTELRAVYVTPDGNAFVDLNIDVTREHGGGSLDELFTVYALVNALTTNVSEIRSVQILVEGREVDTLAGHIDLRHPLERNMKWVAQPNSDGVE